VVQTLQILWKSLQGYAPAARLYSTFRWNLSKNFNFWGPTPLYRQSEKNLLSSNISSTGLHNMVNFGPLAAEIVSLVSGIPANFNEFRVLAALLHGTLVVVVSQTLRRWTEGATYIRQGGQHVGHWPTFLVLCYTFEGQTPIFTNLLSSAIAMCYFFFTSRDFSTSLIVDTCLSCENIARQSCGDGAQMANFWPFQTYILNSHYSHATPCVLV